MYHFDRVDTSAMPVSVRVLGPGTPLDRSTTFAPRDTETKTQLAGHFGSTWTLVLGIVSFRFNASHRDAGTVTHAGAKDLPSNEAPSEGRAAERAQRLCVEKTFLRAITSRVNQGARHHGVVWVLTPSLNICT